MKEEEEEVISNGTNDDDTNNINSSSEFDNNRIGGDGDDNCNLNQTSQVWGTWEELVLAFAVKHHAFNDWDSVAKEVQVRTRSSLIVSAVSCRLKYQDLKRRFQDSVDSGEGNNEAAVAAAEDEVGEIPWLEQLRSLHMAELRREVERCDDSILSLQLKVKKLEEEKDGSEEDKKPDLGNDKTKPAVLNREDNRSMNESNSTASVDNIADHEPLDGDQMVKAYEKSRNPDPDPVNLATPEEKEERRVSKRLEMSHSGELDESGTSTGSGKRIGQKYRSPGGGGDIKSAGNKSQPMIDIIKLIRSHPRGSVFESRRRSQATKKYKSLIRQHLDIKSIEKKVEAGSYVSSSSLSFYKDLMLLFTNAIVFFPASSPEFMAAQELRTLVSNEIKKRTGKPCHSVIKTEAESSGSRQKFSVLPLVVCKKKKSASEKTSPSSSFKQKDERKTLEVSEEKTVTTTTTSARSSRRTSKEIATATKTHRKADSSNGDDNKEETSKTEKKKKVAEASDKKKSVADFLKRIMKNSPQKGKEPTSKNQKKSDGNVKKEDDHKKKGDGEVKKEKAKPRELRSNSTGKKVVGNNKIPPKRKQTKETAEATRKRGRESGKDNKQPKKRSRR